jgi:hypothetical protein
MVTRFLRTNTLIGGSLFHFSVSHRISTVFQLTTSGSARETFTRGNAQPDFTRT